MPISKARWSAPGLSIDGVEIRARSGVRAVTSSLHKERFMWAWPNYWARWRRAEATNRTAKAAVNTAGRFSNLRRACWTLARLRWVGLDGLEPSTSSLSGMLGHGRYVLRSRSAGLPVCPRVTVTVPGRPSHRARSGHDPVIRSYGRTVQTCPGVAAFWGDVPGPSSFVGSWPRSWQQFWQQSNTCGPA